MKKAQLFDQPFVMIFALILGALILVFGVKSVMDLQERAAEVQLAKSINDFKTKVNNYYNLESGSQTMVPLNFNSKLEKLCFLNPKEKFTNEVDDETLKLLMESSTSDNLFLVPLDIFEKSSFNIPHLKVNSTNNPICFTNKEQAILTTRMNFVEISKK